MAQTIVARFWPKVERLGPDECWEWIGYRNHHGYGVLLARGDGRRTLLAHRVSWELHCGPIPDGLFVCHACDNPPCVNPGHLWLGTPLQNKRDQLAKGRMRTTIPPRRPRPIREERFWAKVDRSGGPDACWLWTAGRDPAGYGRVRVGTRTRMTHVVTYEARYGLVPDGLQLDHLCRNRRCCNPNHLEPVTAKENVRRAKDARGDWAGHGSAMEYRRGCRCDECVEGHREYGRAYAQRVSTRRLEAGSAWPHGTLLSYNQGGCRCEECCEAAVGQSRAYRAKRLADAAEGIVKCRGNRGSYDMGCRCEECRAAHAARARTRRARRREQGAMGAGPHGRTRYTNDGCRCEECRQAMAEYMRAYRARRRAEAP